MSKFFEVKNKTQTKADVYFYGDIVSDSWGKWTEEDRCPQDILNLLAECNGIEELDIYINSGGGSVWAGVAIYNILKRFNAKKTVHIDGLAASIASVIALAGDEVIMPKNSFMMIHKAWCYTSGNADELRATADMLDTIEKSIVNIYMENAHEDIEESFVKELMSAETWLEAEKAAELFKNITVSESVEVAACISDYRYSNTPNGIIFAKTDIAAPTKPDIPNEEQNQTVAAAEQLKNIKNFIFLEEEKGNE